MFSRLVTMLLFTWSVYMAAFGQHIFGRDDIIEIAHNFKTVSVSSVQSEIIKTETETLKEETSRLFASIAPSAGQEEDQMVFTFVLVDSLTPEENMPFLLGEQAKQSDQKDDQSAS